MAVYRLILVMFCAMAYPLLSTAQEQTLAVRKNVEVLVSAKASEAERHAAEEVAAYLGKMLDTRIAVNVSEKPTGAFPIIVGWHPLNAELRPETLGEEETLISIAPDAIRIVGGKSEARDEDGAPLHDRGTLYAAYDFLEMLGVRWYRPEPWGEHVPKLEKIELPIGNTRSQPVYKYRYGIAHYNTGAAADWQDRHFMAKEWAIRNRQNTNIWRERNTPNQDIARFGGSYEVDFSHAYSRLIPHKEYFEKHPEWFALINGKRSSNPQAQLCLGNPELQEEVFRKVLKLAKENPNQGIFSLDPNDTELWCECALCVAMDNPDKKAPYGKGVGGVSMSNRVLKFNSIIARRLADEMPGKSVGSYAYWQYTEPPSENVKVDPNVVVQPAAFAGTYSDYSRKLDDPASKQNSRFLKVLEGYRQRGVRLFAHEYWSCYIWPGPLPIVHTMTDRLRNYHSRFNVEGVYSETHPCWGPQGMALYFYTWLLRNPHGDVEKEKELYYRNFYGPASGPMRSYHERLEEIASSGAVYFGSGGGGMDELFTPELIAELDGHIAEAQRLVAGQEPYEQRLASLVAGHELAKMSANFRALTARKEFGKAAKVLNDMEAFYYSFEDGSVFDVAPGSDGARRMQIYLFRDYRKLVDEDGKLLRLFTDPHITQIHNVGWRFNTDTRREGRPNAWSGKDFDDSRWGRINAGKSWQQQGHEGFKGEAWYRKSFTPPAIDHGRRMILYFDAVGGNMEVFLNGKSILVRSSEGGPKEPVYVDITDLVKMGEKNQLSVAVESKDAGSGLLRPVYILDVESIVPPT